MGRSPGIAASPLRVDQQSLDRRACPDPPTFGPTVVLSRLDGRERGQDRRALRRPGTMADIDQPSASSIESASRGDPKGIADVLAAYLPRLEQFVRVRLGPRLHSREETLDIVQSTVRELLCESRFELRGEIEFRAWLFQAALNRIREKARFHAAEMRSPDREVLVGDSTSTGMPAIADVQPSPSRIAMAREELARVESAFAGLTEPQREVLTLSRIAGLPHAVIARQLGKSEVAVRQLLVRAMAALGAQMDEA